MKNYLDIRRLHFRIAVPDFRILDCCTSHTEASRENQNAHNTLRGAISADIQDIDMPPLVTLLEPKRSRK